MRLETRLPSLLAFAALTLLMPSPPGRALDVRADSRNAVNPREITPRGDLASEERATIDLFERSRNSVVFITTKQAVVDFWSRNVMSVPRGTGSGFIWEDAGHIVTNFHVIQGASEGSIKLVDGRSFQALVIESDFPAMHGRIREETQAALCHC